jgi:hypothetical protein
MDEDDRERGSGGQLTQIAEDGVYLSVQSDRPAKEDIRRGL